MNPPRMPRTVDRSFARMVALKRIVTGSLSIACGVGLIVALVVHGSAPPKKMRRPIPATGGAWTLRDGLRLRGELARTARCEGRRGRCLSVHGEVTGAVPFAWSGAMLNPGDAVFAPVDLSLAKEIVFSARGDGQTYQLLLFTRRKGREPARHAFVAGKRWTEQRVPLSSLDPGGGSDVVGIAFVAGPRPGRYAFQLDDIALR